MHAAIISVKDKRGLNRLKLKIKEKKKHLNQGYFFFPFNFKPTLNSK